MDLGNFGSNEQQLQISVKDAEDVKCDVTQQHNLKQGLKKFGEEGKNAAVKEVRQQHA